MTGTNGTRPSIYPTLLYADAKAAIRQLTEVFGFTESSVYEGEDGLVMHAELVQGNGAVMLGSKGRGGARSCVDASLPCAPSSSEACSVRMCPSFSYAAFTLPAA